MSSFSNVTNSYFMSINSPINVPVIGVHQSPLSQKFGIPRQPNLVDLPTKIVMLPPYDVPEAFMGIEQYSHLWITWQFHQNKSQENFRPMVRPPRLGGNEKVGVFATRSMYRPSQLGLSVVTLDSVAVVEGQVVLHILGADMVDGTPIIDIKPYLTYSDSIQTADSGFATSKPSVKTVVVDEQTKLQFMALINSVKLQPKDMGYICDLIAQDPRPAYKQSQVGQVFKMRYKNVDVAFVMQQDTSLLINHIQLI